MPTREELNLIHNTLDEATRSLGEVREARILRDEVAIGAAIDRATFYLGACKEALRPVHPTPDVAAAPDGNEERRARFIKHATDLRLRAQETMATVAGAALALSVTFRGTLTNARPADEWWIRVSWVTFAICVVAVIADRFVSSARFVVHGVGGTFPSRDEKAWLATPPLVSMLAFMVGMVALLVYGLRNL